MYQDLNIIFPTRTVPYNFECIFSLKKLRIINYNSVCRIIVGKVRIITSVLLNNSNNSISNRPGNLATFSSNGKANNRELRIHGYNRHFTWCLSFVNELHFILSTTICIRYCNHQVVTALRNIYGDCYGVCGQNEIKRYRLPIKMHTDLTCRKDIFGHSNYRKCSIF